MSKAFNTVMIILLVLGIMGIVLGITVGLYRNDQLAKMQAAVQHNQNLDDQSSGGYPSGAETDGLTDLLLNGNLHTILLGTGTFLTMISVGIFLISIRKQVN
jgi:hypothetical protein